MSTVKLVWDVLAKLRDLPSTAYKDNPKLAAEVSWANGVESFEGYANGWEADKGVVSGNWNNLDEYNRATREWEIVSTLPRRFEKLFERYGVKVEWSDTVDRCEDCNKCIETEPSSYYWTPQYHEDKHGGTVCEACIKDSPGDTLNDVAEGDSHLWAFQVNPAEYGWTLLDTIKQGSYAVNSDRFDAEGLRHDIERGFSEWLYTKVNNHYKVYVRQEENEGNDE